MSFRKPSKTERRPRAASDEVSALPSTQFAFRLFEALKPGDRNLAISPYSARVVLAEIYEIERSLGRNYFAYKLLRDLVAEFLMLHNTDSRVLQRLGKQFEIKTSDPRFKAKGFNYL
jgi:hypothetical protein